MKENLEVLVSSINKDIETDPTLSITKILKKYNLSYYEWKKLNIKFKNRYHPSEKTLEVIKRLNAGERNIDIAKQMNISRQRVTNIKTHFKELLIGRREEIRDKD